MRISIPLFLVLLIAQTPVSAQAPAVEVSSIIFDGNEAFPEDSLARAIVNRETTCGWFSPFFRMCAFGVEHEILNERELSRDILRLKSFYNTRGYRDARVDTFTTRPTAGEVELSFQIDEGMPVRVASLTVEGADVFEEFDPAADLPMQVGGLLNAIDLAATRDTLIQRFRNRGYPRTDVSRWWQLPTGSPYEADVTFEVETGPHSVFGPISLIGNQQLDEDVIRQLLPFEEGQEFSAARLIEAQRGLFSMDLVQRASIVETVDPAGVVPDSVVPLQVRITEAEAHSMYLGGGWSTSDCLNAETRWTSRNFHGGARRLQLRARVSNLVADQLERGVCYQSGVGDFGGMNWLVSAEFSQPLIGQAVALRSSLFFERQSLQDVFVRQAVGVDLSLSQTVDANTSFTLAYRPQLTQLEAAEVFFCTSFLVCTPEDVFSLQEPNWLAPLSVSMVRTSTNNILNPTRGYQLLLNFEHSSAVTGSEFRYDRAFGEVAAYLEVLPGQVLAARLGGGWVGAGAFVLGGADIVHPQKRFFSGGANSVRGFAQNQLGPRVLTVDPARLLIADAGESTPICDPDEIMDLTCNANALDPQAFGTPRPTGGSKVFEGGVEYRVTWGARFETAAFVDFGRIWTERGSGGPSRFELAPGVGIRYLSRIGPIRVDVGYPFRGNEDLQVVTSQVRAFGAGDDSSDKISRRIAGERQVIEYVPSESLALLAPPVDFGPSDGFFLSRLQLHLSIGQAF